MSDGRLTYGEYLMVPRLLELQRPLATPPVHGEMLFVVVQQIQELWFKQILHELPLIIDLCNRRELAEASYVLDRVDRILHALCEQVEILEDLPPLEFQQFRAHLKSASGFESEQFRELEIASGLRDEGYLRFAGRLADVDAILARWPVSLRDAFDCVLDTVHSSHTEALVQLYNHPSDYPDIYRLAESLSTYELRFREWRFHHLQLVTRIIGDRTAGTAGSPGHPYLVKTLEYRFFPELWEARNLLMTAVH
jgi:tryptophan 2,3-dioxygenase